VIVVDFGSTLDYSKQITKLCADYKFEYVYKNSLVWSRSRSLNAGIEKANGDRVFFIDADTILPRDYVLAHLEKSDSKNYTFSFVYDSHVQTGKTVDVAYIKSLPGNVRVPGWSHFSVDRQWLIANNGYNEEYQGWGEEDYDIELRMQISGLQKVEIENNPVHLWHPSYEQLMEKAGKLDWYKEQRMNNKNRFTQFRRQYQKRKK
jgi:glycosyltransferase involved in cell wall biosynthesis